MAVWRVSAINVQEMIVGLISATALMTHIRSFEAMFPPPSFCHSFIKIWREAYSLKLKRADQFTTHLTGDSGRTVTVRRGNDSGLLISIGSVGGNGTLHVMEQRIAHSCSHEQVHAI